VGLPVIASRMVIQPCRGRYRRRLGIVMLYTIIVVALPLGKAADCQGPRKGAPLAQHLEGHALAGQTPIQVKDGGSGGARRSSRRSNEGPHRAREGIP
jgi:hypothetical protein